MAKPPPSKPPSPRPPSEAPLDRATAGGGTGGAERCAFCGRREIEAGRLIAGAKAAICADCIRKLGQSLKGERGSAPPKR